MSESQILVEFERCIRGQVSLEQFHEWVVSNLQAVLDSRNDHATDLMNQADAALIQLGADVITERDFIDALIGMIRSSETQSLDSEQEQVRAEYASSNESFQQTILTERAPGIEVFQHVG